MRNWKSVLGALVIGAGLCNSSYGFEWLDQLIGIDLDNSEGATFYQDAQPTYRSYSAGYAPYSVGYAAPVNNGCNTCAPQTTYRTYYQPVVTYQAQPQVMPYTVAQPVYTPAPSYARPGCGCSGN